MEKLKILDLFSGIGGFSLGLERTGGFETVAFCEVDKKATLVLNKHWPDVPVFDDVKTLSKDKLDDQGISIDVICGGFPCQDISLAGKGAGLAGERSGLWWEFHRLIKEIQPQIIIAENVSALRSRGLDQVLRSLSEIGYDAEWHCIPASAVGAPHQRDRIWIVAYPHSVRKWARIGPEKSEGDSAGKCSGDSSGMGTQRLVANTASSGLPQRGQSEWQTSTEKETARLVNEFERCCSVMAYANGQRLQGRQETGNISGIWPRIQQLLERCPDSIRTTWAVEPDVGRISNGVPKRVDRLKQLGNAVVPQIPELIGYAILENMKNGTP